MPINIDKAFGEFPQHLSVYGRRSSLLASNIANADTPGYKARDIDFRAELERARGDQMGLKTTNSRHLGGSQASGSQFDLLYRVPHQPSLDGNTVDGQVEQAEFTQNAIRYQSTLTFLNGRVNGLKLAIKGE